MLEHSQSTAPTLGRIAAHGVLVAGSGSGALRVLHLHSGNMMGGIESMLITLAECMHLCPDLEQSFALTFDSTFAAKLRAAKATVHLLPQVRLRHLPSIYQSRRQLRMLLREFDFDVVISHSPWIQLIFGDVVRNARIPLVFWMHGAFDGHWLQKLASFHRPDFAICNSIYTRSTLDRCYPNVPRKIIRYPVSLAVSKTDRQEIRSALGIKPEEVVVFTAARMEPWKGHHNLLRAAGKLTVSTPWRVLIAGAPNTPAETAYFESLKREATSLGVADRVEFLGFRTDVPALMAACDIHCQPNDLPEPFGIVFVEALQAGVPIVTFAMGGAQEILDSNTGLLVERGNIDALAHALSRLIEDRTVRSQLGSAGPARAYALCDPGHQMRMLTDTLRSVAKSRAGAAIG